MQHVDYFRFFNKSPYSVTWRYDCTTSRCAALLLCGLLGLPNRSAPPEIILDPFPLGNLSLPSLYLSCLPPPRPPDPPRPPHPPREVNLQHPFLCLPH